MSHINGLICIDLWETDYYNIKYPTEYYQWLDLLPDKLQKFKFDSIINASYHTQIDYKDPSIYNTLREYNWLEYDEEIMLELIKTSNNFILSESIKTNLLGDNSFALYSVNSFLKHINKLVPHIKDWLVVGAHWQMCTHGRDLGLKNLAKLSNLNFYGAEWGFIKINNQCCTPADFATDSLVWEPVDNLYKLKSQ